MTIGAARQNRTLLFRLYLLLGIGLIAVATVLDLGFRELQMRLSPPTDPWREATFALIRSRLADAKTAGYTALAEELSRELGLAVQILQDDFVVSSTDEDAGKPKEIYDADGRVTWLIRIPDKQIIVRLDGKDAPAENLWLRLIPPLFYLSIFVFVGLWLRPLLHDLDAITSSTRQFAADYRQPRPTADSVSSLTELAENFDAMSSRLSALIQGQKELTSALSHEMRTPLARIRFALAVIGDKATDNEREELAAIANDVQEIDRLIATMLNYARLDHPDTQMNWQEAPAGPWLTQTVEKCRLPGTEVRLVGSIDSVVMDARLMTLALSNLLVNACRHASGQVEVSLNQDRTGFRLTIDDDGKGIPEADRDRVFKAFTRLDGSRNRDTGGYGLGLAIVARVANLHGGAATAGESPTLGGARMTIAWPHRS